MITAGLVWEWIIKSFVYCLLLTGAFAYLTLTERRVLAKMQSRIGPNRTGKYGLLQPIADAVKAIFKEELAPAGADQLIFFLAPIITVVPALIVTAVVPWGTSFNFFGKEISLVIADVNVAVLYIMAVTSISVYGITLAGWSSNNKYATMGGLRSTAQMVSYELGLGLSMIGPVVLAGSMSLVDMINDQQTIWYIFKQPVAFILFFIAVLAETNRSPFDLPEAEHELTAGYHAEYSGMKFAVFYMAEYTKMICVALIGASIFLGGYLSPLAFLSGIPVIGWLFASGPIWLIIKVIIWLFTMIWVRATLPRFRYDRLMQFGWKVMFPVGLLNVVVTAVIVVLRGV